MINQETAPLEDGSVASMAGSPVDVDIDEADAIADAYLEMEEEDYLKLTRSAYESSTDYMSSNLRKQWERNISNFHSTHPNGSKYYTSSYLNRSRVFRPKSRSSVRQNEAAAVAAFFSTQDIVSVTPENFNNPAAEVAADIQMELLNYRLTKTIDWFQTLIGAFQDTMVYGTCPTRVEWEYQEVETGDVTMTGEVGLDGELLYEPEVKVIKDEPVVEIIANENFRIDPAANWQDPVADSPYIIHLMPMYVKDVKANMTGDDPKTGKQAWRYMTDSQLLAAISEQSSDSTRLEREDGRQDPADNYQDVDDFTIVWVYRVIMDIGGTDMTWYTLGSHAMLTDPVPLSEVCLTGKRPYVLGKCVIESNRNYPAGLIELGQDLQAATNDNFNQRLDNIKLALNSRSFVKRSAQVDLRALKRSLPGGIVMTDDPIGDVRPIEVKDVTSSSYIDQDRMSADFDEIMGSFSQSSINTNRNLSETVGGMSMMKEGSNMMTEYLIRVFAETWVEPVLEHLINLEKEYETNIDLLQLCADRAKLPAGTMVTPDMLQGDTNLSVSVGYGATDPQRQVMKFMFALDSVAKLGPKVAGKIKAGEVVKEVFGHAGYKNGAKFFEDIEDEQQQGPPMPPPPTPQDQVNMAKVELERQKALAKYELEARKLDDLRELAYAKLALEKEIKLPALYQKLGVDAERAELDRKKHDLGVMQEMSRQNELALNRREMSYKERTGNPGI